MTSVSSLKDQIISRYLFDERFDLGEKEEGQPGVMEAITGCLDAIYVANGLSREQSDYEWGVPPGATLFRKIQLAFRSVTGEGALVTAGAERGNLGACYRSLKNEKLKESRLRFWMALPGSRIDYPMLMRCSGNEVEERFQAWLKENPECLKIKKLKLLYKYLEFLPPEIGLFTSLESLNLTNNKIMVLPPEIGNLTQLKSLDSSNNELAGLPPEIGCLKSLESLVLNHNNLKEGLPPEVGMLSSLMRLEALHCKLKKLPKGIGKLSQLRFLNLECNGIRKLPRELGRLSLLKALYLEGNTKLRKLPSEIWDLKKLTLLELPDGIEVLPREVGYLTQLEYLTIPQKVFDTLPREFRMMPFDDRTFDKNMIAKLVSYGLLASPKAEGGRDL